jgi:hypothetical protein
MNDDQKPKGKSDAPVGYVTQDIRRRRIRPVHSRKAILEQAEAAFKSKPVPQN